MTTSRDRAHARELDHMDRLSRLTRLASFTSEVYRAWAASRDPLRKGDLEAALILLGMRQERLQELSDHDEQEFRDFLGMPAEVTT
jgi:hypothetical protein